MPPFGLGAPRAQQSAAPAAPASMGDWMTAQLTQIKEAFTRTNEKAREHTKQEREEMGEGAAIELVEGTETVAESVEVKYNTTYFDLGEWRKGKGNMVVKKPKKGETAKPPEAPPAGTRMPEEGKVYGLKGCMDHATWRNVERNEFFYKDLHWAANKYLELKSAGHLYITDNFKTLKKPKKLAKVEALITEMAAMTSFKHEDWKRLNKKYGFSKTRGKEGAYQLLGAVLRSVEEGGWNRDAITLANFESTVEHIVNSNGLPDTKVTIAPFAAGMVLDIDEPGAKKSKNPAARYGRTLEMDAPKPPQKEEPPAEEPPAEVPPEPEPPAEVPPAEEPPEEEPPEEEPPEEEPPEEEPPAPAPVPPEEEEPPPPRRNGEGKEAGKAREGLDTGPKFDEKGKEMIEVLKKIQNVEIVIEPKAWGEKGYAKHGENRFEFRLNEDDGTYDFNILTLPDGADKPDTATGAPGLVIKGEKNDLDQVKDALTKSKDETAPVKVRLEDLQHIKGYTITSELVSGTEYKFTIGEGVVIKVGTPPSTKRITMPEVKFTVDLTDVGADMYRPYLEEGTAVPPAAKIGEEAKLIDIVIRRHYGANMKAIDAAQ